MNYRLRPEREDLKFLILNMFSSAFRYRGMARIGEAGPLGKAIRNLPAKNRACLKK